MTARLAFLAGRSERGRDIPASANPHHDWLPGVAWALGWHWPDLDDDQVAQMEAAGWTHATCEGWAGAEVRCRCSICRPAMAWSAAA